MWLMHALAFAAKHAKLVLVLGLIAGIAFPGLALALKPWIGEMVAALLFLAALRVGPRQAMGALGDVGRSVGLVVIFQLLFPLVTIALFGMAGWASAVAIGLVLMLAASPVSGSPNLTIMTGNDPAPALRQLVIGTALLPLTIIPVFWLSPAFGEASAVLTAAGGLMVLIAIAAGLGFIIRSTLLRQPSDLTLQSVDGVSAIAMGVVVVGLMSAVGPALVSEPGNVAIMLAVVFAANIALQVMVATAMRLLGRGGEAAAIGIVAGNRNIALFLTVLPQSTVDPILLFIGCYQIPMYLTPAVLGHFYRRL